MNRSGSNKRNPTGIPPDGVNIKSEIMYAIVEIAGQQFKVEKDKKLFVHHLDAEAGDSVDFEKVLLVDNDGKVAVGTPTVKGAKVTAKVLEHVKGDKVIVNAGSLKGLKGELISEGDRKKVMVRIDSIDQNLIVEVHSSLIEIIREL